MLVYVMLDLVISCYTRFGQVSSGYAVLGRIKTV